MDCFKIDNTKNLSRFFNALPYGETVDIYANGKLVIPNLKYKDFTPFSYGQNVNQKIDVYKAGTKTNPIIRTTIKLPAEQIFTIAITGNKGEESLLVLEEDITQKPSNTSSISKIANLSPDLPEVDVNFNGNPFANNISYRDETLYEFLPEGEYTVTVEDSATENHIIERKFEFKNDRIYTIYIFGDVDKLELLQAVDGNTYVCL